MIHDDEGTPRTDAPPLSDDAVDAFLDKVDADHDALTLVERRRLRRSVQQAQRQIIAPESGGHLAQHLDAAELFFPAHTCDDGSVAATAQAIAAETITAAKARAAALIAEAEDKAREVEQIALKTLRDAHRDADAIRALAEAERNDAHRDAQQARNEAAAIRERTQQVLAQAEQDAAALLDLAREEAEAHQETHADWKCVDRWPSETVGSATYAALTLPSRPHRDRRTCPPLVTLPRLRAPAHVWRATADQLVTWETSVPAFETYFLLVHGMTCDVEPLNLDRLATRGVERPHRFCWPPATWRAAQREQEPGLDVTSDASYDLLVAHAQFRRRYRDALRLGGRCLDVFASTWSRSNLLTLHDLMISPLDADVVVTRNKITHASSGDLSRSDGAAQSRAYARGKAAELTSSTSAWNTLVIDAYVLTRMVDQLDAQEPQSAVPQRADQVELQSPVTIPSGPSELSGADAGELAETTR